MTAYLVGRALIHDPLEYNKYIEGVGPLIARYQGKVLARGGDFRIMEGPQKFKRFIVIEFPSLEHAQGFFTCDDYNKAAIHRRNGAGEVETVIVEGIA